jgi:hypothetical protein
MKTKREILAEELVEVSGVSVLMEKMLSNLLKNLDKNSPAYHIYKNTCVEDLKPVMAKVYAESVPEQYLEDYVCFYKSSAGQYFVDNNFKLLEIFTVEFLKYFKSIDS